MAEVDGYIIKVRDGKYKYKVNVRATENRLFLNFAYNEFIKDEIKVMQGSKWHPETKEWSVTNCSRNLFQLTYLAGGNPYERYDKELVPFTPRRKQCFPHQIVMAAHVLTRRQCIFACEMGTGKTLAMIEAMEASGTKDWWWVGPKSALYSVELEFKRWTVCDTCGAPYRDHYEMDHVFSFGPTVIPRFLTYEGLRKVVDEWDPNVKPPHGIVFDESSRLKNHAAQRSQAALILANTIRATWKDDAWVVCMSGSPAPKSPLDWWHQCEVACPGYLREGTHQKFQRRLAIIEERQSVTGGVYPHHVCWRDNPERCDQCGQKADSSNHSETGHVFKASKDEISYLYRRMKGLVLVQFKKDCLDLPEKRYEVITLKPTQEMISASTIINARCATAITALTLLRELSDGFQYKEEEVGTQTCPICNGSKIYEQTVDLDNPEEPLDAQSIERGFRVTYDEAGTPIGQSEQPLRLGKQTQACPTCYGTGEIVKTNRTARMIPTPKEDALRSLLDIHEDVGRLVVYGGFTGSIDRIVQAVKQQGWEYIRVDGRGWQASIPGTPIELLEAFQYSDKFEKLCFIGQPGAAGMGLNLTASPSIVYYSNDFNAESRIQSEDRIHRPGMDVNRGATIYDLVLLPSDLLVLNNLKRKKRLQDLTMGEMSVEIEAIKFSSIRSL